MPPKPKTPEERVAERERIEARIVALHKARMRDIPEEAHLLDEEADRAARYVNAAHNAKERADRESVLFAAQKRYLESLELRPCGARDCLKPIISRSSKAKYCSNECKHRERQKRKWENNPDSVQRANLNYLKSIEQYLKEDDIK